MSSLNQCFFLGRDDELRVHCEAAAGRRPVPRVRVRAERVREGDQYLLRATPLSQAQTHKHVHVQNLAFNLRSFEL